MNIIDYNFFECYSCVFYCCCCFYNLVNKNVCCGTLAPRHECKSERLAIISYLGNIKNIQKLRVKPTRGRFFFLFYFILKISTRVQHLQRLLLKVVLYSTLMAVNITFFFFIQNTSVETIFEWVQHPQGKWISFDCRRAVLLLLISFLPKKKYKLKIVNTLRHIFHALIFFLWKPLYFILANI